MECLSKVLCLLKLCLLFSTANAQSIDVQRSLDGGIILLCNAHSNDDNISYKWFIDNDKPIINDKHYELRGNELIFKTGKSLHNYFKCVIELRSVGAKYAISKNFADLKIYRSKRHKSEVLKFSPNMVSSKSFDIGSTGRIHCKATGIIKIYWKRNENDDLPQNVEDVNGTLIFTNVDNSMKGIYTCFASNESNTIMFKVEVKIPPTFEIMPPEKITINELQSVLIDCSGPGTIKWDFEAKMINSEDERFQIFENGSLFIKNPLVQSQGRYGCTIGNSAGLKRVEMVLFVTKVDIEKPVDEELEGSSNLLSNKAVLITCSLAVFYIICVIVLMFWCRQSRGNKQESEIDPEQLKLNDENDHNHEERTTPKEDVVKSFSSYNIRFETITEMENVGIDGNLKNEIMTGFLSDTDFPPNVVTKDSNVNDEIRMQQQTKVIIRTIKTDQDEKSLCEFKKTADLYRTVDSENVVKLLGLTKEPKIYGLILEHGDDFKSYIMKNDISIIDLLKFSHQLANGVNAIHSLRLIHRDISLSNSIISIDHKVKLTFKTSTDSPDYYDCYGHKLPVRHSAPEIVFSCKNKSDIDYSFASDIYAFGITLWEIFNKAAQPFKSLTKDDLIKKLYTKTLELNLIGTAQVPYDINDILLKCIKVEAGERINSEDLTNYLLEAIRKMKSS